MPSPDRASSFHTNERWAIKTENTFLLHRCTWKLKMMIFMVYVFRLFSLSFSVCARPQVLKIDIEWTRAVNGERIENIISKNTCRLYIYGWVRLYECDDCTMCAWLESSLVRRAAGTIMRTIFAENICVRRIDKFIAMRLLDSNFDSMSS